MRERVPAGRLGATPMDTIGCPRSIDMTTSWPPQNLPTPTQHRDPLAVVAAMVVGGIAVLTLFVMAITFAALAVAFPFAEQFRPWMSAHDFAIAQQAADFWWVFAGFAVASFAAAAGVALATIRWMLPTRDA